MLKQEHYLAAAGYKLHLVDLVAGGVAVGEYKFILLVFAVEVVAPVHRQNEQLDLGVRFSVLHDDCKHEGTI